MARRARLTQNCVLRPSYRQPAAILRPSYNSLRPRMQSI
eukprot:COSAG01_NODE_74690_length_203_cov_32.067308_1_plen_38_part_01